MSPTPMALWVSALNRVPIPTPPVGGFVAWYDSTQIVGFADGASLTSWADKSGNGHTLTQFSTNTLPTYSTTSTINAKATVHFSGTTCSIIDNGGYGTPLATPSVVLVAKANAGGNFNFSDGGANTHDVALGTSGGNWEIYAGTLLSDGAQDTTAHFFCAVYNGASSSLTIDNGVATTGAAGSLPLDNFLLGNGFAANLGLSGLIGEAIVYPRVLSGADIAVLHGYAQTKWGVA